jgi:hypothetical protein
MESATSIDTAGLRKMLNSTSYTEKNIQSSNTTSINIIEERDEEDFNEKEKSD